MCVKCRSIDRKDISSSASDNKAPACGALRVAMLYECDLGHE